MLVYSGRCAFVTGAQVTTVHVQRWDFLCVLVKKACVVFRIQCSVIQESGQTGSWILVLTRLRSASELSGPALRN